MDQRQIEALPDYGLELSRCRLRYCGIGARIADTETGLWPRDSLKPNAECTKLLYQDLRRSIENEEQTRRIEFVIQDISESLRLCRIDELFQKCCRVEPKFLQSPFSLRNRQDAHTEYCKIHKFIYSILRSIKIGDPNNRSRRVNKCSLAYLFGSNSNINLYKRHLKVLVSSNAKLKRIIIGRFVCLGSMRMNLNQVKWLDGLTTEVKYRVFIQIIFGLTRFIAEVLRRYFYIMLSNPYVDKIFYLRYDLWQRMRDEVIRDYVSKGLLEPIVMEGNMDRCETSKIRFLHKMDDIRLICTRQGNSKLSEDDYQLQAALMFVLNKMPHHRNFSLLSLKERLMEMRDRSLDKPIYFVRADMEDCFHSIKQEKLISIISNRLREQFPGGVIEFKKYICTLKRPRRGRREMTKWSCSKELILQSGDYLLADAVETKHIALQRFITNILSPQVMRPVLRISKTSKEGFRLLSGIRQGFKSSPLFCSIYIQQALNEFMGGILTDTEGALFRYVDDLLYMTTDLPKAQSFVRMMLAGFEDYGLKSNASKLACNFPCPESPEVRQLVDHVVFFKRQISIKTLSCTHVFAYPSVSIDQTFYINPYTTRAELQANVVRWSRIEPIHLDTNLNGRELVVDNLFQHALMVAYRVAAVHIVALTLRDLRDQQPKFVLDLSCLVAKRFFYTIIQAKRSSQVIANDLDICELKLISLTAFLATWTTNKMRHRKRERDRLERRYQRSKMAYLTLVSADDQARGVKLERKLRELKFGFTKSSTWKEMRLPDK